jgi:hypothetical protein
MLHSVYSPINTFSRKGDGKRTGEARRGNESDVAFLLVFYVQLRGHPPFAARRGRRLMLRERKARRQPISKRWVGG